MSDHKRIAKNTLFLYGRIVLSTVIGLFSTRLVLQALGVADYGVFNVVGGIVGLLGFFNASMSTGTQRFLNVGMVEKDERKLNQIFSTAINIHVIIGLCVVVLLETVGLWFLNTQLTIPEGQKHAAQWVYQFSIISFFVSIISTPYSAALIAHEKMGVFAVLSIINSILNLGLVIVLIYLPWNKLILWGAFQLGLALLMRFIYNFYCNKTLTECKYKWVWDKSLIKGMTGFSGWMVFGCVSDILSQQGVNMLINIFFGPLYNAARGIAMTVYNTIAQFSENFMMSVNPQIVISYAKNDLEDSFRLSFLASRLSFYLMMIVGIPIFLNAESILKIWLAEVPPLAPLFVQLIIIEYTIRSSYNSLAKLNQAYGKIKVYQLSISVLFVLIFVGTYLLFHFSFPVYYTFILSIAIAIIGLFTRLIILKIQQGFPAVRFLSSVILRISMVGTLAFLLCYILSFISHENIWETILYCIIDIVICGVCIWTFGLNKNEKSFIKHSIFSKILKIKSKCLV